MFKLSKSSYRETGSAPRARALSSLRRAPTTVPLGISASKIPNPLRRRGGSAFRTAPSQVDQRHRRLAGLGGSRHSSSPKRTYAARPHSRQTTYCSAQKPRIAPTHARLHHFADTGQLCAAASRLQQTAAPVQGRSEARGRTCPASLSACDLPARSRGISRWPPAHPAACRSAPARTPDTQASFECFQGY